MSSPIVIHVLRPYANEDEYLAHARSSIDSKSMLLIDQRALPAETAIVLDVQLVDGHKPIRAEGKVIGYIEASANHSAGLRLRFKRFGAATKALIDRATSAPPVLAAPSAEPPAAPSEVAVSPGAPPETVAARSETSGIHRKVSSISQRAIATRCWRGCGDEKPAERLAV